jgi:hypothetical protein
MNEKHKNVLRWVAAIALFVVSFGLGLLTGAFAIDTKSSSSPDWSKLSQVDIEGARKVYGVVPISLSEDGTRMAVGDPVYGENQGRVQVYQRNRLGVWKPNGQALLGDPTQSSEFGYSVALSNDGTVMAVGGRAVDAIQEQDTRFSYMKVYENTGTAWRQMGDTVKNNSDSFCDPSVTLSGNGSRAAMLCSSNIRVVEFDGTTWSVIGSEIPSLYSTKIVLSSDGDVLASTSSTLDFNGTDWIARDPSLLEEGSTVKDFSLSGDSSTVAVTFAYGEFPQETVNTKVYYFSGLGWKQLGQSIGHGSTDNSFDFSRVTLAMDGRTMAIAASDWGTQGSGTVRVYSYNGNMWSLRGDPLVRSDDEFGVYMDMSGDGAVVAAYAYKGGEYGAISSYHFK